MPLAVLRNPVIAPIAISNFFTMFVTIGLAAYLPFYYQLVYGISPGAAGLALLAPTFGSLLGNWRMGVAMGKIERPKNVAAILLAAAVVCMTALALTVDTAPFVVVEILLAITACATGAMFPIGTVSTQNAAERHHLGVAVATLNFIRTIGAAVGGAVCGALVLGSGNTAISDLLERGVSASGAMESVAPVFATMFGTIAACLLLSLIFLLLMEHRPLRGTI
jgi:predicted MFS family arabinose efflux permease